MYARTNPNKIMFPSITLCDVKMDSEHFDSCEY